MKKSKRKYAKNRIKKTPDKKKKKTTKRTQRQNKKQAMNVAEALTLMGLSGVVKANEIQRKKISAVNIHKPHPIRLSKKSKKHQSNGTR